jgi:hypothetical protein
MVNQLLVALIGFVFIALVCPSSAKAALLCSDIFEVSKTYTESYVTADKIAEGPGLHGGKLTYLKKKLNMPWESRLRVDLNLRPDISSNVAQGDPTILIRLMGDRASAFWGYKQPTSDVTTLPDAQELQGAVIAFNKRLADPKNEISLKFYQVHGAVTDSVYLNNFVKFRGIPVAKDGIVSVHDRSVHPIHAFIDPRLDNFAVSRMGSTLKFLELVKYNFPEVYKSSEKEVKNIVESESKDIDIVSAAMTGLFAEYFFNGKKENTDTMKLEVGRIWNGYLNKGSSAQKSLKDILRIFIEKKPEESLALKRLFKKFEDSELSANSLYDKDLEFKKNELINILLARFQFVVSQTPE